MADKEWEQQLDERIRWNSFLPLLGTKAFEKVVGKVWAPLGRQPWEQKADSAPQAKQDSAADEAAPCVPQEGEL